ncbi:Bax inhibitor-1/YccA family protein [Micromonospora sp. DR5-3]|uniref:Bax inhibitor-1/YccA family protein n=1 Tax=unclassified Micromonospora TaxID=2617518 RepID=UPI0011D488B3|nr:MULTISPECIES: Bax inhibitor-1/YccA family protein [unclassified Micromonospora]MCW3814614.1 Bax inhibitor-1/YccA family protein [Micromonospora sp. DR5-3]TYC22526.1 Bax inhibitor-1/YccA family protein [Micromonospora sp. MP36]
MKTSNPVLARLGQAAERERAAGYAQPGPYGQPGYPQQYQPHPQQYPTPGYGYPAAPPTVTPMTLDDVVVKTVMLLGLLGVSAAAAWVLVPDALVGVAWIGAALVGLVLGMIISFSRMANPALVVAYSIVEGVFVGMVSKAFESLYNGIVLQAVVATFGVFFLMAALYKARVIRATPKFTRIMIAVIGGLFAVMLINLVLALFGVNTGLRDSGPLGIGFSLVCIVVASLSFVLNFAQIEDGVRMGLPQRYAWTAAFGIVVGLVWLYLEVLRLLSYFQGDD